MGLDGLLRSSCWLSMARASAAAATSVCDQQQWMMTSGRAVATVSGWIQNENNNNNNRNDNNNNNNNNNNRNND